MRVGEPPRFAFISRRDRDIGRCRNEACRPHNLPSCHEGDLGRKKREPECDAVRLADRLEQAIPYRQFELYGPWHALISKVSAESSSTWIR